MTPPRLAFAQVMNSAIVLACTLPGATTLDLTFAAPLLAHLTVELRGENVTNTRVETTLGADGTIERATPRTLWIGLRYRG